MADRYRKEVLGLTWMASYTVVMRRTKTKNRSLINRNISVIVREREVEFLQVKEEEGRKDYTLLVDLNHYMNFRYAEYLLV